MKTGRQGDLELLVERRQILRLELIKSSVRVNICERL